MSEQELVRALQDLVARHTPPPEPRRLGAEVISRDRLRVGLLAGLTTFLWLGGIAGVLYMIYWFNQFVIAQPAVPMWEPGTTPNQYGLVGRIPSWQYQSRMELHHSLEACLVAVPALLLAALCTVWLVFSSRRATLNQINVSLAEISEQLRQMRQSAPPPQSG